MTDLNKLDYTQLRELAAQVAQQIAVAQKQALQRAGEQIEEIAKSLGMSVPELLEATGVQRQKAKKQSGAPGMKGQALYHNPADASQTWTGRGRKPFWLVQYLGKGGELEKLRIAQ
jgi:DNA-binding protein H-NS